MKKRSGFTVMARLIGLVKPLSGYMVLAILMGLVGHLCAAFITIFGGFAVLDLLGFATPVVLKTTFVCVLLFALVRGVFRYKPDMREKIRAVMRFSGPRMIFYHPVAAIRHVVETKREKKRLERENR